ncbi:4-amino-4-deoxychorismate lyase [Paenibacillus baekrokdamisoli]|uniref:aminodeoxychorismate lyase n=1 Tax=Paenibacillus baekrokdamisoli TaxID=1712516 RepID=A0A3G9IXR5_9BACL|nr:aminodeoxychorismate lyase [Paenibacillus baekrokdamisoli]MBB3073018.1 4-amino-4-deoxychorismate lyase [Paenibacillus baekrokdamisoli]BBH23316.1 4-amino-4-deoxychorismate lyase [Paenibacillus baekrokdamisoli]
MNIGWNGAVKQAEEAVISVYDHGFLYGMGLFETFRTYGGQPYLLERHLHRLSDGCRSIGIHYTPDIEVFREWLTSLMESNQLTEAYVRLTVTAGESVLGLPSTDYMQPNVLLLVKSLPAANAQLYEEGRQLALLHTKRNTPEGEIRLKSLHYMNNIVAKRELLQLDAADGAEGLMLTREGWLAEGIVSNLFFVQDGTVYTPSIDTGILPGVTRSRVIELAQESGYSIAEGLYTWSELLAADEVWVTNSIQELVPVTTLRDRNGYISKVGAGTAGVAFRELLTIYREKTRSGLDN